MSPNSEVWKNVLKSGVGSLLKESGFRKKGMFFWRRWGKTFHLIQFQLSSRDVAYVNVAISLDALRRDGEVTFQKTHACPLYVRLNRLSPSAPHQWESSMAVEELVVSVVDALKPVLVQLQYVEGPADLLATGWLDDPQGADLILSARLLYAVGDDSNAMDHLKAAARYFADRRGMSVEALIDRHGMSRLAK